MVFGGVLCGVNGCAEPPPRGHHVLLKGVTLLSGGGASAAWPERHQLPDGNGRALLAHC